MMSVTQQFTTNHKRAIKIMFKLAISHYPLVRQLVVAYSMMTTGLLL